jgi:hypothetical protein
MEIPPVIKNIPPGIWVLAAAVTIILLLALYGYLSGTWDQLPD